MSDAPPTAVVNAAATSAQAAAVAVVRTPSPSSVDVSSASQNGTTGTNNNSHHASTVADKVRELNRTGVGQMRQGALEASVTTLQLALSLTTDIVSGDQPHAALRAARATTLSNLGCLYRRMGQLSEAIHHLQAARDVEATLPDNSGSASCSTMLNLCTVLIAMNRIEEGLAVAYRCAERAAADAATAFAAASTSPANLAAQSENVASTGYIHTLALHNLAVAQQSAPQAEDRRHAASTMLRALEVSQATLGDHHPTTAMLRVKCGVPAMPKSPNATQPLAPRAPGQKAPATSAPRGRSEAEAARESLKLIPTPSTPLGNSVTMPHNSAPPSAYPVANPATTAAAAKPGHNTPAAVVDVMEGAAFTNGQPDAPPPTKETTDNEVIVDATLQVPSSSAAVPPPAAPRPDASVTEPPATVGQDSSLVFRPSANTSSMSTRRTTTATTVAPIAPPRNVLVLQNTGTSADRPPSFMRFAPNAASPPPPPTTFADIREDLRVAREHRKNADAAHERMKRGALANNHAATDGRKGHALSGHAALSVDERKRRRIAREEVEEQLVRERRIQEEHRLAMEAAHNAREAAILLEKQTQAARLIQHRYRRWWHDIGYVKSAQRRKEQRAAAQQQRNASPRRSMEVSQRMISATTLSQAVVKCARKWLKRSYGRLLLFRLTQGGGAEGRQRMDNTIRIIQRCWRVKLAHLRVRAQRRYVTEVAEKVRDMEKGSIAAALIQRLFRTFVAKRELHRRRHDHQSRPAIRLQRWYRELVRLRQRKGLRAQGLTHRVRAAIAIQRVWRGYLGRLQAVMYRLKRRVTAMRASETSRTVILQRVARGYQTRLVMQRAQRNAEKRAALIKSMERQQTHQAVVSTFKVNQARTDAYLASAVSRSSAVTALREREREAHHIPLVVDEQAARHRQEYQRIDAHTVRMQRAEEQDKRSVELLTLQRERSAIIIQRFYRRRRHLLTIEATSRQRIAGKVYERDIIRKREAVAAARREQLRLRAVNDLAAQPRALAQDARREAAELEAAVTRHGVNLSTNRPILVRASDARAVKSMEDRLEQQTVVDEASLRAVPTFMTQRQRRLLVEQRSSGGEELGRIEGLPSTAATR